MRIASMAVILCLLSSNVDALTSTSISEGEKVAVAFVIDDVFYLHASIIRVFPTAAEAAAEGNSDIIYVRCRGAQSL